LSRISTKSLIRLSHRVGTAVRSGIDARRTWEMEERNSSGTMRSAVSAIKNHVAAGGTVAEAMHEQHGYFPPMYVQMVAVGEQTGKLDEVLLRLAEHYEHQTAMKRMFWIGIAWPLLQLLAAVMVIGLVIWLTEMVRSMSGNDEADILGWGLSGTSGALIWFFGVGLVVGGITVFSMALSRGLLGPQPVLMAMRIPVLGKCLEAFALSRLTWSLALALDSGMDAIRSAELALKSAQNPYYETALPRVLGAVRANQEFHEAFRAGEVFPLDFIQQLESAELSGTTSEGLHRLAKEYEDRARTAVKILTGMATAAVWVLFFGIMIFLIFTMAMRIFAPYYDAINDLQSI
jgi:type II secretory pathway component PulF